HKDGISLVDQFVQELKQLLDIIVVKARRRFVKKIESVSSELLAELGGKLHPLCLAAAQRRRRLSEPDIAQSRFLYYLQLVGYPWDVLAMLGCLVIGEVEHISY